MRYQNLLKDHNQNCNCKTEKPHKNQYWQDLSYELLYNKSDRDL